MFLEKKFLKIYFLYSCVFMIKNKKKSNIFSQFTLFSLVFITISEDEMEKNKKKGRQYEEVKI